MTLLARLAGVLRRLFTGPPLSGPRLVVPLPAFVAGPGARLEIGLQRGRPAVRLTRERYPFYPDSGFGSPPRGTPLGGATGFGSVGSGSTGRDLARSSDAARLRGDGFRSPTDWQDDASAFDPAGLDLTGYDEADDGLPF